MSDPTNDDETPPDEDFAALFAASESKAPKGERSLRTGDNVRER